MPQRPMLFSSIIGNSGLSPTLWNDFPVDEILTFRDRNAGFGFFDDFDTPQVDFPIATGAGTSIFAAPYTSYWNGASAQVQQLAEVAQGDNGLLQYLSSTTASSEWTLQRGGYRSTSTAAVGYAPFVIANFDLCFETRVRFFINAAGSFGNGLWSMFFGLAAPQAPASSALFTTATAPILANIDLCGIWVKAQAVNNSSIIFNGAYQNSSGIYSNGAGSAGVQTGGYTTSPLVDGTGTTALGPNLFNLGGTGSGTWASQTNATGAYTSGSTGNAFNNTLVNSSCLNYSNFGTSYIAGYITIGFRYWAQYQRLSWYINGIEANPISRLGSSIVTNQSPIVVSSNIYGFPNATGLTPTIAVKAGSGTTQALTFQLDWLACAQAAPAGTTITGDTPPP